MIKKPDGFKKQDSRMGGKTTIPVGAYVCSIIGAKEEKVKYNNIDHDGLVMQLEVIEGDCAGIYKRMYEEKAKTAQQFNRNIPAYPGTYRITIPNHGDPVWMTKRLETFVWTVEDSNPGFEWDWTAASLKGKLIGINVQERHGIYEGKQFVTTQIGQLEPVKDVRDGKCIQLKPRIDKELGDAYETPESAAATPVSDIELPF